MTADRTALVASDRAALAALRRARRRRRTANFDVFEAFYRAYITAIVGVFAVLLLSGVTGDHRVTATTAARAASHGPQIVGAAISVVWAIGVRSGGRGGPLAIEAADVRHVLLAPVDRTLALRGPAFRQLRFAALVGAAIGGVGGVLAFRRLPGNSVGWVAAGAATGLLAVVGALGLALCCSGRRVGRVVSGLVALALLGWSGTDVARHTTTSPASFLGALALWPLQVRGSTAVGAAVAVVAVVAGLLVVGGTSVEAAERRASLVGQIRFAATLRDLRTVVVLRRQLAQEAPRQRPWVRMPRAIRLGDTPVGRRRAFPSWRRAWHGVFRFPAFRLARLAVLGAVAGASTVALWRGTTPMVIVAGLALYVAGLDACEPVAQEMDAPDRTDSYPFPAGDVLVRLLGPSVILMILVAAVGLGTAEAITGGASPTLSVGVVILLPAALCGLGGALISVVQGPPPAFSTTDTLMPPEAAGIRSVIRVGWPPLVAILGVAPVIAGKDRSHGVAAWSPVLNLGVLGVVLGVLVGVWLRYRVELHASLKKMMEEASATTRTPAGR